MSNSSSFSSSSSSPVDFLTLCHHLKKGWLNHGINGSESIADHMYRMALMDLTAGDVAGVNRESIKMTIVHDIAEADEIKELWAEYENNSSLEANLVKDFDKVETILQALEYETGKTWVDEVISRRKSTLSNEGN